MQKWILIVMGLVCAAASVSAQYQTEIKPLHIGDTVPDITLNHIINYRTASAKLSDFRGKPIILDFFATWCGSCLAALPKLDSLQQTFGDGLQTLVIDYESTDKVRKFLKNNSIGQSTRLPFVTDDSLLSYIVFPHRSIPHEVWIDADGIIRAITLSEYVTTSNLQKLIKGKPLHLPLKKDIMDFDNTKLLFVDGNGGSADRICFRSTLAGYIDGLGVKMGRHRDSLTRGLFQINRPILALYGEAVRGIGNRIILEVKNKKRYINDGSLSPDQWARKYDYSYELVAPLFTPDSILRQWMYQDLNRWLNLNARWEKRKVSCWSLVMRGKDNSRFRTKGGKPELQYGNNLPTQIFHNEPLGKIVATWNEQTPGRPLVPLIINETRYTGNADLELKVKDLHDIPALRTALQPFGLDLIPVKRELDMFVITENSHAAPFFDKNMLSLP